MPNRRSFLTTGAALFLATPALGKPTSIRLRDLYDWDRTYSDLAQSLNGHRVVVSGYMAPPLRAEAKFFVLTRMPMSACPFCEAAAEWPDTILAVYTKRRVRVVAFNAAIDVYGTLDLGEHKDIETGFVSLVRVTDATYR